MDVSLSRPAVPTVAVLTAALPSRLDMLAEAKASVLAQTWRNVEHLIGIDTDRQGAGAVLNRLLSCTKAEWVMVLDDDDLLDPGHVEIGMASAAARDTFDVSYSMPRVEGGTFTQYREPFVAELLARGFNCVSHTALMRRDLVVKVGGWNNVKAFDLDLFRRLEHAGADFHQILEETWTYRLHGANWSRGTLPEAALL